MKKSIRFTAVFAIITVALTLSFHVFSKETLNSFSDVPEKEWYAESVEYVYQKGLMNGTTETTFEPETYITRGMIVTIIYRMENSPETVGDLKFSDVNKTYYYAAPITWATENKIVNGYSENTFAPDDKITREQFATILYRYADFKGVNVSLEKNSVNLLDNYSDSALISDYAKNTMTWTSLSGLITGVTSTTLEPQGIATRAQATTIFMRFDKLLEQSQENDGSSDNIEKDESNESEIKDEEKEDKPSKNENSSSGGNGGSKKEPTDKVEDDKENDGDGNDTDNDENAGEWDDVKDETVQDKNEDDGKDENDKDETAGKEDAGEDGEEDNATFTNPAIVVESLSAQPGETVEVVVKIYNNPGIAGATYKISYNSRLELKEATNADALDGLDFTGPGKLTNPCNFTWDSEYGQAANDGEILKLSFAVPQKAETGDAFDVECSYRHGDVFDEDLNDLEFEIVNGRIIIE